MTKTDPPTEDKKKRPSKIAICDIAAYVGAATLIISAIIVFITDTDQWQPHYPVSFLKPHNPDREYEAIINLYSPTFGAGSNITIHVIIIPDPESIKEFNERGKQFTTDKSGIGLPPRYYMMFEGSTCEAIPTSFEERYKPTFGCALPLEFWHEKNYYRNMTSIVYPIEGTYGVIVDEVMPNRSSTDIIEDRFIQIAPLETRLNYINSEYIWVASWVAVYVALVSLYLQIRKGWKKSLSSKKS